MFPGEEGHLYPVLTQDRPYPGGIDTFLWLHQNPYFLSGPETHEGAVELCSHQEPVLGSYPGLDIPDLSFRQPW
jgi:hypothetical protein